MKRFAAFAVLGTMLAAAAAPTADAPAKRTPKQALQPFNELIGSWRATGLPQVGTKLERQRGAWQEKIAWEWQFKGDDCWLSVVFDKSKNFVDGKLRYVPDKDAYELTLQTTGKETVRFEGKLKEHLLTMERADDGKKETQRIVISLLHSNRYLYHYEVKGQAKTQYVRQYQVGATKEGEPFAVDGPTGPECIVSGGPGTMPVTYKGKTYYVCCGGCRSEFLANPEKFIKEFEEAKAKKDSEKKK